jgi:hypothetical protein
VDDAGQLREVLSVLREAGLAVSSLRVGSIALVVAPARAPLPGQDGATALAGPVQVRSMAEMTDAEALPELRRRSREQFGYVKSDAELLPLKGAL